MRFWDSSGIASLVLDDAFSDRARSLVLDDGAILVWCGTETEAASAIFRAVRAGRLPATRVGDALARLDAVAAGWREVPPGVGVRREARRVLPLHPLRAGDALQLGAALVAAGGDSSVLEFVCFDDRLSSAARAEGFTVLCERP